MAINPKDYRYTAFVPSWRIAEEYLEKGDVVLAKIKRTTKSLSVEWHSYNNECDCCSTNGRQKYFPAHVLLIGAQCDMDTILRMANKISLYEPAWCWYKLTAREKFNTQYSK